MIPLLSFGWGEFHQLHYNNLTKPGLLPGRIISIKGFKYFLITEKGELETELSGKLMYTVSNDELPKVGDWVLYMDYEKIGYIIEVLPRTNQLERKNPGTRIERQVLAANIDYALVVQGLDRDFNMMRLERYLVQIAGCNINPVIILNKADLVPDPEEYKKEVLRLKRDAPVYVCSTHTGTGLKELIENVLIPCKTFILIGSSGVGKSSLLNAIGEIEFQKTNAVSDFNNKGKHTTTTRDLFQLPNGSLVIDTPGMREFGLTSMDGDSSEVFPGIEKFAGNCRFSDCKHLNEKGCGVIAAVDAKELDRDIYESYLKLVKEQKRFEINIEDKKRLGKQAGKMSREANDYRKKFKF